MKGMMNRFWLGAFLGAIVVAGCSGSDDNSASKSAAGGTKTASAGGSDLKGTIKIDGSSTVFPISERMSEDFKKDAPDVDVPVGQAGTGSGMKKFVAGEIDICDASRPIKPDEIDAAKKANIDFIELPVAFDGLSIIVNPKNNWIDTVTIDDLKKIWEPDSKVKNWNDVKSTFPNKPIKLYGPGTNHGTYEYFAEAVVKNKAKATRQDYQQNQEYNALVQGVSSDENSLGYVGFAYYDKNKDKLKLLGVDAGKGAMKPSVQTISDGTYSPLSRPLFIYVNKKAMDRPEVKKFVEFYLGQAKSQVGDVGYVALPDAAYDLVKARWAAGTTGSAFNGVQAGMKVEDVLAKESAKK